MAFKLAMAPTFGVRVTVEMLNERGAIEKSTFLAQFRRYKVEDFERLKERWLSEGKDDPVWLGREVLVGWKDLETEDGQVAEYDEANKELLLSIPPAAAAVQQAFLENVVKAREKN